MAIKTVAVIGASGNIGAPIVKSLLEAGFKVTAITRESSTSTFPEGVEVRKTDLASIESVTKAFAGQDAVISTIASAEIGNQNIFADAAIAAGVKRYIPSEFGHNSRPGKLQGPAAALLAGKTKAVDYLIEQAKTHPEFTWTGVSTSPFFDWGLDMGVFGIDFKNKTARIFDSGNQPASACTLAFVGEATVAVLQHEEETANKYIEVAEFQVTQNQIIAILEEESGAKFTVSREKTSDLARIGLEKISRGEYHASFLDILQSITFVDGAPYAIPDDVLANKTLGLQSRDLRDVLKDYVKSRSS
ncbi:isoflavone reductase [Lasiosphaeria hispida]|uniref:Isoflavone reductase n=1 Tax=Lasiosphaeria hispida TaxID=260671 RepID=A0AAJ0MBU9_9PEZI|nr:isoflavone reductase [Lasiosphaeria hispida]